MRKYNIPLKDTKEVKQEIVECSSSGGGVKEYYYKIIKHEDSFSDIQILADFLGVINNICLLTSSVFPNDVIEVNSLYHIMNYSTTLTIEAFRYIDTEVTLFAQGDKKETYFNIKNGNLIDRTIQCLKQTNPSITQESIESFINNVNLFYQEITKEEYEAMITYKPE